MLVVLLHFFSSPLPASELLLFSAVCTTSRKQSYPHPPGLQALPGQQLLLSLCSQIRSLSTRQTHISKCDTHAPQITQTLHARTVAHQLPLSRAPSLGGCTIHTPAQSKTRGSCFRLLFVPHLKQLIKHQSCSVSPQHCASVLGVPHLPSRLLQQPPNFLPFYLALPVPHQPSPGIAAAVEFRKRKAFKSNT